jgi:hypothetical protein
VGARGEQAIAVLGVVQLFLAAVAAATATNPSGFPAATTKVASGTWNGVSWTLFAGESVSSTWFSDCISIVVGPASAHHGGMMCGGGGLRTPGELLPTSPPAPGLTYGIGVGGNTDCPAFNVLTGLVVAGASQVVVTLAGGKTVTAATIPSPPGLAQSLRFWALHTPCGVRLTAISARNANGAIVARVDPRFIPQLGSIR